MALKSAQEKAQKLKYETKSNKIKAPKPFF